MDSAPTPAQADAGPLRAPPRAEPPPPLRLLQRWAPPSASVRARAEPPAGHWWSRWWGWHAER